MTDNANSDERPTYPSHDPNAAKGSLFLFNRPTVIALLYLASYFTGISGIVGVVLAYIWRKEEHAEWEGGHFKYLIRTFWMSFLFFIVSFFLFFAFGFMFVSAGQDGNAAMGIIVMFFGLAALALVVLLVARSIRSIVRAQKEEPIPNPRSWLF